MGSKNIICAIIEKSGLNGRDFMGFEYDNIYDLTFHHIKKKANEGKQTIANGAVLTKTAHNFLNYLELVNKPVFNNLNIVFKELALSKKPANRYYWEKVDLIVSCAKKKHWQGFINYTEEKKLRKLELKNKKECLNKIKVLSLQKTGSNVRNDKFSFEGAIQRERKKVKAYLKQFTRI